MCSLYDSEIKEVYLQNLVSEREQARRMFSLGKPMEERLQKDIGDFTESEIKEFLSSLSSSSYITLLSCTSVLRTYSQWRCENNLSKDNINHYMYISGKEIKSCVNLYSYKNKYISLEELRKAVDNNLLNDCDRALIYCLFYGIDGKNGRELKYITKESINPDSNVVRLVTGREVHLPAFVIELLLKSCNQYSYLMYGKDGLVKELPLDGNDKGFIKRRATLSPVNEEEFNIFIISRLGRMKKYSECNAIGKSKLKNSGILHFLKKMIEEGKSTKEDIFTNEQLINELKNQFGIASEWFTLKQRFEDYL